MFGYGGGSVELETGARMWRPPPLTVRLPTGRISIWFGRPNLFFGHRGVLRRRRAYYWGLTARSIPAELYRQLFSDLGVVDRVVVPNADDRTTGRTGFLAAIDIL